MASDTDTAMEAEIDEFVVERILKRRHDGECTLYLIKWEGYPDSENTWEPKTNLNCPDLVAEFEAKHKKRTEILALKKKRREKSASFSSQESDSSRSFDHDGKSVFDRSLVPECIVAAIAGPKFSPKPKISSKDDPSWPRSHWLVVKWRDTMEADVVKAEEANVKCPQLVIDFYERHLRFFDEPPSNPPPPIPPPYLLVFGKQSSVVPLSSSSV